MTRPDSPRDIDVESGPVDAPTRAEFEAATEDDAVCADCGEARAHLVHTPKPTRDVIGDEHDFVPERFDPEPPDRYDEMREREWNR